MKKIITHLKWMKIILRMKRFNFKARQYFPPPGNRGTIAMAGPVRENCFSVLASTLRAQKAQSLPPADKASAWRWEILTPQMD